MSVRPGDRGSVAAEFAVAVPTVVLVIVLTAGTLAAAGRQVRLEQGAAQAARLAARGESAARVAAVLETVAGGTIDEVIEQGDLVCVTATAPMRIPLALPPLRARSCALAGGH